jgi:membrane protease YdiL (CAAX protease family)
MDSAHLNDSASRAAQASRFYPGLLASFGFIILYFALQALCTGLIMAYTHGVSGAAVSGQPLTIIWGLVASSIVQLGLMWLYLRRSGRITSVGLNDFGRMRFAHATGLAVLLVIAAMVFNFVYATYLIPGIGMQDEMAKILSAIPRTPINVTLLICAIAIMAPIVEEVLFRGFLQNALAKYVPFWAAILLSSFLFAVVHLQPYAIPGLMSLSLAFGYLYHRTGSLRTNIILHMANNAFALLVMQFTH